MSLAGANVHSSKYGKKQLSSSNGRKNAAATSRDPPNKTLTGSNSVSNFAFGGGKTSQRSQMAGSGKAGKAILS